MSLPQEHLDWLKQEGHEATTMTLQEWMDLISKAAPIVWQAIVAILRIWGLPSPLLPK